MHRKPYVLSCVLIASVVLAGCASSSQPQQDTRDPLFRQSETADQQRQPQAQSGGVVGEKVNRQQSRVEQRTENEVDQATDEAVDGFLDRIFGKIFGD